MPFFGNYGNGADSGRLMDEKCEGSGVGRVHSPVEVDDSSCDKDVCIKMDDQYQSDEEPAGDDASRLQDGPVGSNAGGREVQNFQPSGRRTTLIGKWGSSFWKDCQPMPTRDGSESGQDSKDMDSDYKIQEGSDGNLSDGMADRLESEDDVGRKDVEGFQRAQADVPTDEMLSDDYYEQDGDEQSDSLHHRELNRTGASGSRQSSRPIPVKKNMSRRLKSAKLDEYDYDDDYDEEDEEDGTSI